MASIRIEVLHEIGDVVYFITDKEQDQYIVTGYTVRQTRATYIVAHNGDEKDACEFELSNEKDLSKL